MARTRDTLRIEVADSARGALPVPSGPAADDDENGRDLQVVTALSRRWGCRPAPRGKAVWCELTAEVQIPAEAQPPATADRLAG